MKFFYARRFEYFGLALCIVMGLTGLLFVRTLFHALRLFNFKLIVAGAITYLAGTVVLQINRLRFHNPGWHLLVVLAASFHSLVITREYALQ